MIRHVVRLWRFREQCRALIEIHADDERSRFGRFVYRHAGQKVSACLECRRSVRGALLNIRQGEANLTDDIEGYLRSGHDRILSRLNQRSKS
jgi:hypothetical protein